MVNGMVFSVKMVLERYPAHFNRPFLHLTRLC